jgi:hypothetical protein
VGQVVPPRATLDGRITGWYRIGPESGPLPADTRLDQIDPDETLYFHFVESRTVSIDIEIHLGMPGLEQARSRGAPVIRLRTPVATAVPIVTLVDSLASMFDLPAADWSANLDGLPMGPLQILEDRPVNHQSVLVVRRA